MTEFEQLREEITKLRERVAVLEAEKPGSLPPQYLQPPLWQTFDRIPHMWPRWNPDVYPYTRPYEITCGATTEGSFGSSRVAPHAAAPMVPCQSETFTMKG